MESRQPDPEVERPASQPIHDVRTLHDVRIPVSDGLELSANLWLPVPTAEAPDERFPAILEMLPYRKDDWRAASDQGRGEWLAARGYALCRLDVRGTGSSPGIALDEYTARETQDGYEAVEWLAAQPWSNGNVGMWGISYGGFTSIQVAKLRPPALKAIVPMMATDDRYTDDVHYIGGCVTVSELSQYAVSMVGMNAMPPSAEYRGAAWADEWRERLERTPVWLFEWLRQQHDGPYWRQGSLAPEYDAIEAAIFSIGGWMDSYVDPVLRMHERCSAPRRSLIGNWVHSYPDDAYPGPNLDWLHEMVRFFDHWLKGIDNGVMDEPGFVVFRHEYAPPEPFPQAWPGEWLALETWPPPGLEERVLYLAPGPLPLVGELPDEPPAGAAVERFRHRPTTGTRASLSWGAGSAPNGLARDLRPEESLIPTFTSAPARRAARRRRVRGRRARLGVGRAGRDRGGPADGRRPGRHVLAGDRGDPEPDPPRLARVARAARAGGRPSRPRPDARDRPPVPARPSDPAVGRVVVLAGDLAVAVPRGVRAPSRRRPARGSSCRCCPPTPATLPVPPFKTTPAGMADYGTYRDEPPEWRIVDDVIDGSVTVTTSEFGESVMPDGRTTLYSGERLEMTARDDDPAHARMHNEVVYRLDDGGVEVGIEASGTVRSTETDFHMNVGLRVTLDGAPFFERGWLETIPRRLV